VKTIALENALERKDKQAIDFNKQNRSISYFPRLNGFLEIPSSAANNPLKPLALAMYRGLSTTRIYTAYS